MKITGLTDVKGFMEAVDKCKGEVELVSSEGDRLNLKSKLTQYVALAEIFSNNNVKGIDFEVIIHEGEDIGKLINFLTR